MYGLGVDGLSNTPPFPKEPETDAIRIPGSLVELFRLHKISMQVGPWLTDYVKNHFLNFTFIFHRKGEISKLLVTIVRAK